MNIEGMGESLIWPAVRERSWSRATPTSIASTRQTLEGLERMGKKSAAKVLGEIEKSKSNDVWRLLYGLGIRHVGERGAQVLADHFGSVDAIETATLEELEQVREIGPVLAASVRSFFDEPRNRELIEAFRTAGVKLIGERKRAPAGPQPLAGKTYVITGELSRDVARRRAGEARSARRQGDRLGEQEDDRVDRRQRARREQARESAGTGRRRRSMKPHSCELIMKRIMTRLFRRSPRRR